MQPFHENGEIEVLVRSIELIKTSPAISTALVFRNL
jgi:hypothetical protein